MSATNSTDQYTHPSASRRNLPTEQTGLLMTDDDRRPIGHHPTTREHDDDPVLAWDREPATEPHMAHALYVREKIHPGAFVQLLQDGAEHPQLFESFNGLPTPDAAYEWYRHAQNWQNRLIHGESVRVMASLLKREHMAGQAQMIYFDPPYGKGYKSNFQVRTDNPRSVPDGAKGRPNDTRTVQAFRDTYRRGIHSYLDLTLEKLHLFREMLADTGSLFVQIGDENVHRMALCCDEAFGAENRVATIPYATAGSSSAATLPSVADFILWYAKDKSQAKYHQIYEPLDRRGLLDSWSSYARVQEPDGTTRALGRDERIHPDKFLPEGAVLCRFERLTSPGASTTGRSDIYHWDGHDYPCPKGEHWRVSAGGMDRLAELGRLGAADKGARLHWKKYETEVPGRKINNVWGGQWSPSDKRYVVQTADRIIERCILMSTDPGDLVFDPTCGGATTALAAEKWGRRWITCDTSPVSVAVARQRLTTATFKYWLLSDSAEGAEREAELAGTAPTPPSDGYGNDPTKGFVYKRCQHPSAGSLAYDENRVTLLVDRPLKKRRVVRVTSPLTVESESAWTAVVPFDSNTLDTAAPTRSDYVQHVGEWLKSRPIDGGRDSSDIDILDLAPWAPESRLLAWRATYKTPRGTAEHQAAVLVAAEDVTVPGEMVREAAREIHHSHQPTDVLLVVAYAFGPDVPSKVGRVQVLRAQVYRGMQIREMPKQEKTPAFVLLGEPEVKVYEEQPDGHLSVELFGYDTYDPTTGNPHSGGPDDVACWMVDTDHDDESFFARRMHFPGQQTDPQIKSLLQRLGKRVSDAERSALTSMRCAPFPRPERCRIAVKVVTLTGMEMSKIIDLAKVEPVHSR